MKIIIACGYFNPLHAGHVEYLEAAKKLGDKLFVIVNNDYQVGLKGSVPFMGERERQKIVQALRCVDYAVVSRDTDRTVTKTIEMIKYDYRHCEVFLAKGGDSSVSNTPEASIVDTIFDVGGEKVNSSSVLIKEAVIKASPK
jgi:cytidyltransferase-like protein